MTQGEIARHDADKLLSNGVHLEAFKINTKQS